MCIRDRAIAAGDFGGLGAVFGLELGQDVGDVVLDRALADDQAVGDVFVRRALGQQQQHFALAVGEGFERGALRS